MALQRKSLEGFSLKFRRKRLTHCRFKFLYIKFSRLCDQTVQKKFFLIPLFLRGDFKMKKIEKHILLFILKGTMLLT